MQHGMRLFIGTITTKWDMSLFLTTLSLPHSTSLLALKLHTNSRFPISSTFTTRPLTTLSNLSNEPDFGLATVCGIQETPGISSTSSSSLSSNRSFEESSHFWNGSPSTET